MTAASALAAWFPGDLVGMVLTRFQRLLSGAIALSAVAIGLGSAPALAEGSRNLYPTTFPGAVAARSRANIEWRTNLINNLFRRRTLLKVYAETGERILVGSSANGVDQGNILIFNPDRVSGQVGDESIPLASPNFDCVNDQPGRGDITSRAEELAGAESIDGTGNTAGYTPCFYEAPFTGVYHVVFYGPDGANASANGGSATGQIELTSTNNFNANQGSGVAAWDVTVRSSDESSTTDRDGRLFAYYLAMITGGNGRPLYFDTYPVTNDGYRYLARVRGLDPFGFIRYGNQVGFFDSDGQTPLYHDVLGNNGNLTVLEGGVSISPPQFPTFFNPLDPQALFYVERYNSQGDFIGRGIPRRPIDPIISFPTFVGDEANTSEIGNGGVFAFTSNITGNFQIIISFDGVDFDPYNPQNRVLRGTIENPGSQSIVWDGNDNEGNDFPIGTNYPARLTVNAGEYHFPVLDAENNFFGGPTFQLLNSTNPLGNTTGFYDDRGYRTLNGSVVGTVGAPLCGINPPTIPNSDPLLGFDTTTNDRQFGQNSGGNTNTSCTGSFGDAKGLDFWTYVPSTPTATVLNVVDTGTLNNDLARLRLVKRITAINGTDITGFDNNDGRSDDDDPNWPTPKSASLRGAVTSGNLFSGDEVEFTIYFLSDGDDAAANVTLCDIVPQNMTMAFGAFNSESPLDSTSLPGKFVGIALALDDTTIPTEPTVYLTNTVGDDRGDFFDPGTEAPAVCNSPGFDTPYAAADNTTGAVVVDVLDANIVTPDELPQSTGAGTPANSYGFIRYRAVVD